MGKIATETEARTIGGQGTAETNRMCTNARAIALGCNVASSYADNQLVQYEHLSKSSILINVPFISIATTRIGNNGPTNIRGFSPCLCYKENNGISVFLSLFAVNSISDTGGTFTFPKSSYNIPIDVNGPFMGLSSIDYLSTIYFSESRNGVLTNSTDWSNNKILYVRDVR